MSLNRTLNAKKDAVEQAKTFLEKQPVYLDTETTGLGNKDEIIELSIIDHDGSVLFDELIKPSQSIPAESTRIHHITNGMVANAKTWPVLWPTVRGLLFNRVIGMYNAKFDVRMINQSMMVYKLPFKLTNQTFDIMELFAKYKGEWDPRRNSYRYHSLDNAGKWMQIPIPNSHRAKDDTLLTRELLHKIAAATPE